MSTNPPKYFKNVLKILVLRARRMNFKIVYVMTMPKLVCQKKLSKGEF